MKGVRHIWQINMNITIFGANSAIGKYLIDFFVNDNHCVTAFIDKPGSIKLPPKNINLIVGHAYDNLLVKDAIKNADVVINAFKPTFKIFKNNNYYANNISNKTIIEEMIKLNKKRFITISRVTDNKDINNSYLGAVSLNKILYKSYKKDFKETFDTLYNSSLDWTILKIIQNFPSRNKNYLVSTQNKIKPFVSNYNIAHFLYDASINKKFIRECVIISNK